MAEEKQFFGEDEAEQILLLAARRSSGALSREQLLAAAAEAGISPEAVAEAEKEYRIKNADLKERAAYDKHVSNEFWTHFASYAIVNAGLLGIDIFSDGKLEWAFWPVLGWGIAILFHAWAAFAKGSNDYEEEFGKWRARKSLRESGLISDDDDDLSELAGLDKLGDLTNIKGIHVGVRLSRSARKAALRAQRQQAIEHVKERTGLSHAKAKEVVEEYLEEHS